MIWRGEPSFTPVPALVDEEILRAAVRYAPRVAVADASSGRPLTFGQLADGVRRLAAGLAGRGIGRGDVVAITAPNGPDYAVALFGALHAGAGVASANPALTATEREHLFALCSPRLVFTDGLDMLGELLAAPRPAAPDRDPDDLAMLFPSSGTTGLPKLAMHTHATTTAFMHAFAMAPWAQVEPADVVAVAIPFPHLFGSAVLTHALRNGATVVTLRHFDLEAFLRALQDHAATVVPATPPLLAALAYHPLVDRLDLSAVRHVITSAAPAAPELQEAVEARLGCVVGDYFGLTEAWCVAPAANPVVRGSVGRLGPNLEAMIVDPESGARLGAGEHGELWVRGPQVMTGYVGHDPRDRDGWYASGDLCRLDAAGNLYVIDRLKELIKVGGCSVAPAEVERELVAHPAVADAAVVGRPDAELGEVPVAYVALDGPAEDLDAWLAERLAPWKRPREVVVVERVPRSPAGKLLRRSFA
jgi:acyl-CoA synthetase (AMP-forming)/AMP-acid ligase II